MSAIIVVSIIDIFSKILKIVRPIFLEKNIAKKDLLGAKEAFLTNSVVNIRPIARLIWREGHAKKKRDLVVGPTTKTLVAAVNRRLGLKDLIK